MSAGLGGIVTLRAAAGELGVTSDSLRQAAQATHGLRADRQAALARRLETVKIGRDWFVSRSALDAELARRKASSDRRFAGRG